MSKIGMIAACDLNGLIGYDNQLPWRNKTDLRRFKNLTNNCTLIMGRKTYDSIPTSKKHNTKLPNRIKHILSRTVKNQTEDTKWFTSLKESVVNADPSKDIWICGGASIYKEALRLGIPDFIDLTVLNFIVVPTIDHDNNKAYMPPISFKYKVSFEEQDDNDPTLWHRIYERRPGSFVESLLKCIE